LSANRVGCTNVYPPTRLRVRAVMAWRACWLAVYAMGLSKFMAARRTRISVTTLNFHLNNDRDFAAQAEVAKAHAIDLLHARAFQRCLEGDCEPVYWQGIVVGHVRKYPERLTIEMLRAHMPGTFKTPGSAPTNIETGDKILVMDEVTRGKLIEARRKALMAMPGPDDDLSHSGTN